MKSLIKSLLFLWCMAAFSANALSDEQQPGEPRWYDGKSTAKAEQNSTDPSKTNTTIEISGESARQLYELLAITNARFMCRGESRLVYVRSDSFTCIASTFHQGISSYSCRTKITNTGHAEAPLVHCVNGVAGIGNG